ncbi:hypothetical protein LIER_02678 [Lithospermum erythrorhizon]|uniref:Uncharacterized protein n=1 Tax=Lithospermum erythrorhizon TaxID=34254 RepID=A0AAV3NQR6_LITER
MSYSIASISLSNPFSSKNIIAHEHQTIKNNNSRILTTVYCLNHPDPFEPKDDPKVKREQKESKGFFVGLQKIGSNLKENLSPKKKGDWKDLTLMSLSFAVYVYISQKIVCAYCAWMSLLQHSW